MNLDLPALPSPAPSAAPVAMGTPANISRRAKAAIIVRLLIRDGADIPLEDLPDDLQAELTHQMGRMRLVNQATVDSVVAEFTEELEAVGLSFSGGVAGALETLDGKISAHTAARLRREAGVRQYGNPWSRVLSMPAERLLPVFQTESVEVCAVILSKLEVPRAAELLGMLPGPVARRITYAVSQTSAVTPDAVDRIGLSLAAQLDAEPMGAFNDGPVKRVGDILNSTTAATRDDMLTGLDETDQIFADEVRKAIFTFSNIPARVAPRDLPKILKEIEPSVLVIACAAAGPAGMEDSAEFILENMSKRMADQIREEMQEAGKIKPDDGEEAMKEIVTVVRRMESEGEIILLTEEEATED